MSGNGKELSSGQKRMIAMRIGLRGKLSQDFTRLRNNNEEAASRWVRKLVMEAVRGHPQLGYRIVKDRQYGEKLVIGLNKERGTMGDW